MDIVELGFDTRYCNYNILFKEVFEVFVHSLESFLSSAPHFKNSTISSRWMVEVDEPMKRNICFATCKSVSVHLEPILVSWYLSKYIHINNLRQIWLVISIFGVVVLSLLQKNMHLDPFDHACTLFPFCWCTSRYNFSKTLANK